jgi:hypothetical protein
MVSPGAEPAEGAPCSAALAVLLAFFGSALVLMLEFWERLGSKGGRACTCSATSAVVDQCYCAAA